MPATQPGPKQGTDKTGKRYKYEPGHRGRVKVVTEVQHGGSDGGDAAKAQAGQAKQRQAKEQMRKAVERLLSTHNAFIKSGGAKSSAAASDRVQALLSHGRGDRLQQGPVDDANRALAGSILGTIFNKGLRGGSGVGDSFKVRFNPGGASGQGHITVVGADGAEVGSVKFSNLSQLTGTNINKIRSHFQSAVKAHAAKGGAVAAGAALKSPVKAKVSSAVDLFADELKKVTPEEAASVRKRYGDVFNAVGVKPKAEPPAKHTVTTTKKTETPDAVTTTKKVETHESRPNDDLDAAMNEEAPTSKSAPKDIRQNDDLDAAMNDTPAEHIRGVIKNIDHGLTREQAEKSLGLFHSMTLSEAHATLKELGIAERPTSKAHAQRLVGRVFDHQFEAREKANLK